MARLHTPQFSDYPFHITARHHNKEAFHLNLDLVWKIMSEQLYLIHHFFGIKIHSFVLMPNHFHLICKTDSELLGIAIGHFMRETSKAMNRYTGRCNQTWGSRYYRCEVISQHYFLNCYKYVYQNPVRSKLVSTCEEWKYSTLNGLLGKTHLLIPVEDDSILFSDCGMIIKENLSWLNKVADADNVDAIKLALKKRIFKLPKAKNKKAHFLESELF
ncbi:MAG: hypothetical protein WA160_14100 [Pseudobdellovibrio sp.]